MNLREKVEEILKDGESTCMDIANKVKVDKEKTRYFPGEVNTILRALIKKGKVEVVEGKGPRGGKLYKLINMIKEPINIVLDADSALGKAFQESIDKKEEFRKSIELNDPIGVDTQIIEEPIENNLLIVEEIFGFIPIENENFESPIIEEIEVESLPIVFENIQS